MNAPNDEGVMSFKGTKNICIWHTFLCMNSVDQKRKKIKSFANFTLRENKKIIYKLSSNA